MYEALVERVRNHIEIARFYGLSAAESTQLLSETADAIEELLTRLEGCEECKIAKEWWSFVHLPQPPKEET